MEKRGASHKSKETSHGGEISAIEREAGVTKKRGGGLISKEK